MTTSQKKKYFFLQFIVIFSALLEVFSITLIGPFIAIVGDLDLLTSNHFLQNLYKALDSSSNDQFVLKFGLFIIGLLLVSSALSVFTIWRLSIFAAHLGADYGNILYEYYLSKNYLYHVNTHSSHLVKQIATEVNRVTDNILQPIVQINARIITSFLIILVVLIYSPIISLMGFSVFALSYYLIYIFVKKKLYRNGNLISKYSKIRFSLMNEGFSAIKELKVSGREHFFINNFKKSGDIFAGAYGSSNTLYNSPKHIMEFVVYSCTITAMLFLTYSSNDLISSMPTISVLAMAVFKLLPSFQQIYSGSAQIKNNVSAFESIYSDIINARKSINTPGSTHVLGGELILKNINMKHNNQDHNTLDNINISIKENSTIGIVGKSGAGKSTLLDIMLGVITPTSGHLAINNVVIDSSNRRAWQNNIGYVPQLITLIDGTILENIAFGIPSHNVDINKVKDACSLAQLTSWIQEQPLGLHTHIGEKGTKISGGQRQRIAIARALYNDVQYLFLDEATSALDGITEKNIMGSIDALSTKKTIVIIAHRVNTLKKCDFIYFMDHGKIVDSGTYNELIANNKTFQKMAMGIDDEK